MTKAEKANLANRTKATAGAMAFAYKELEDRLKPQLQHLTAQKRVEVLSSMAAQAARIASQPTSEPSRQPVPALRGDGR